jgi:hypothetical protein
MRKGLNATNEVGGLFSYFLPKRIPTNFLNATNEVGGLFSYFLPNRIPTNFLNATNEVGGLFRFFLPKRDQQTFLEAMTTGTGSLPPPNAPWRDFGSAPSSTWRTAKHTSTNIAHTTASRLERI